MVRARLHFRKKEYELALQELDKTESLHGLPEKDFEFYFTKGDVLDALGRYEEAIHYYHQGNRIVIEVERFHYQRDAQKNMVGKLKQVFTGDTIRMPRKDACSHWDKQLPSPVFIIGFPRSGTTLVEQIITGHPEISAGDELSYINRSTKLAGHMAGNRVAYPGCFSGFDSQAGNGHAVLEKFRTFYGTM